MDDANRISQNDPSTDAGIGRRALLGRALLVAGAGAALMGLAGCPGGSQDDDGDDSEDGEDD